MAVILTSTANIATLQSPDAYVQILNPPSYISGVPTDIAACVGPASWGPLNTPIMVGSPEESIKNFGRQAGSRGEALVSPSAELVVPDLIGDAILAFSQAQQSTLQMVLSRVGDGSEAKATVTLLDSTPATAATANALFHGTDGNSIQVAFFSGTSANTYNVSVTGFPGGPDAEVFPNIAGSGASGTPFWTNLQAAVNNGMSGIRGPSNLIRLTGAVTTGAVDPPVSGANQTRTLASGVDGKASLTATLALGSDTAVPKTGIYALRSIVPSPSVMWVCGLVAPVSATATVPAVLAAFGDSEGIVMMYSNAAGRTTANTITDKRAYAQDTPNFAPVAQHHYFFDPVVKQVRLIPPYPVMGGRTATLAPQISPLNKQVYGIIGTERSDPSAGTLPYSPSEIGQLQSNGIMFIAKPIPAGNVFGFRTGVNSSSDAVKSPMEFGRFTNYLAKSFAGFVGKYVGQLQSTAKNDPLRAAVNNDFVDYLSTLQSLGQLDTFSVTCDLTNNTQSTIAKHFLFVSVKVRYLSSVWYFIVQLQGGTTVVTAGSSPGQALQ